MKMSLKIIAKIIDDEGLKRTITRLAHEIIERNRGADRIAVVGVRTRGATLAQRIVNKIEEIEQKKVPFGILDITLYRDDLTLVDTQPILHETLIDFDITDKKLILVDDVLFTGRSVRAALDAMMAYGRPNKVELMVLINRKYTRDLPISPDYIGKDVNTIETQKVLVDIGQGKKNKIWLINEEE